MSRARSIDDILADAEQIARVWAENPTFVLNDITFTQFQTMITELRAQRGHTEDLRTQLTASSIQTNDKAVAVNNINTRVRSGIRGFFGPNSTQYDQVGGTRTSERKRPTRKKKPGGDSNA
jgi:glycine/serine hydroxymethyltransferase